MDNKTKTNTMHDVKIISRRSYRSIYY